MRFIRLLFIVATMTVAVGLLAEPVAVQPMHLETGRPVVAVTIGGAGPFKFVVDTAASAGRVSVALVRKLNLEAIGEAAVRSGVGAPIPVKLYRLDHVMLGNTPLGDLQVIGQDPVGGPTDHDGILGLNAFKDVLLTLDYPRSELRLDSGSLPEPDGKTILPYSGTLQSVDASAGSASFKMHPDSGSPGGFVFPLSMKEQLPLAAPPQPTGQARTMNAQFQVLGGRLTAPVRWGAFSLDPARVEFVEGLREPLAGYDVLRRFALTIDQKNHRIRWVESTQPAPQVAQRQPRRYGVKFVTPPGIDGATVTVASVDPGSPAEAGGLRPGDELIEMNGQPLAAIDSAARARALSTHPLQLKVRRGGTVIDLALP